MLKHLSLVQDPSLSLQAESELKRQASVYDIYASHMDSLRTFSAYLWIDTDISRLEALAADTTKKLRAVQQLKGLAVLSAVEAMVAAFAAVLPLLHSVRHEALRPRHWNKLMEATGKAPAYSVGAFL